MKKTVNVIGMVVILLTFVTVAKADLVVLTTTMTGPQEVPPTPSTGIGSALVTLDTATNLLTVNIAFAGLVSPTTVAHIHCCAGPTGTAIPATTTPSFPGFPTGIMTGTYINTFDLTLASSYNPAFITANGGTVAGAQAAFVFGLLNGQTYMNIHTSQFPNGEIRGQLQVVPEPATLLLLTTGIIGAGVLRKHRRRG